jgi:apolipoprotein N-acyltransferase
MTIQQFALQLAVVTALTAAALWGLFQVPALKPYQLLGWVSLGGFVLLSFLMYLIGDNAAKSSNKNHFTNVVLGFTGAKMMLALMIVFAYLKLAEPSDKLFIIPFFAVYFIFTGFETYLMMRLGKTGI